MKRAFVNHACRIAMEALWVVGVLILGVVVLPGCALQEVRGKNQFGPEFQHNGSNRTNQIRYYAGQSIELKWDNGWTNGLTYRYRPIDEGNGNQEHLVLFEVGYPLWKAPKPPDATAARMEDLQRQVDALRSQLAAAP